MLQNKNFFWIGLIKTLNMCIGLLTAGLGMAFMHKVGWGSVPSATIIDGVHAAFGLSHGGGFSWSSAGTLSNLFFLVILLIADRRLIGVGTILAGFCLGFFSDLGLLLISPFDFAAMDTATRALILVIGSTLFAIGLGYYIGINFGVGAIDGISVTLSNKTKLQFSVCRWITDSLLMATGVALGGAWGAGTILSLVITGPIMQIIIRYAPKLNQPRITIAE